MWRKYSSAVECLLTGLENCRKRWLGVGMMKEVSEVLNRVRAEKELLAA
ncbi:MAG: hypothetical protein ACE5EZ_00575 [Thermodesulfobacteriota bacterium]